MKHICTITTQSHMHFTLALRESVMNLHKDIVFSVLIVDAFELPATKLDSTEFYTLRDIENAYLANDIEKKYHKNKDKLRWCLKPVFINFLLSSKRASKVIYVDNDIFFFNDFDFLFVELNTIDVLLCPHWRCTSPKVNKDWFLVNFTDGFYNAGFFAANNNASEQLKWWADACYFKCAKVLRKGLFDDQKYLDFMPLIFPKTGVIKHRGCNVAFWNQLENKRILINDKVLINGEFEIIFIHFTKELIKSINNNTDALLKTYLNTYNKNLKELKEAFL